MPKHVKIAEPKVEVRELYGFKDFYEKILSPFEQQIFELFVLRHMTAEQICKVVQLSRRSVSWRLRKISNKVWFFGTDDLARFYLHNAGYERSIKWKPWKKVYTKQIKRLVDNKTRGVRKFVRVDTLLEYKKKRDSKEP